MSIDRKKVIEEEHKKIWAKPIVAENRTFDQAQIEDFFALFNLYADNRRQADVREIVTTARTLGFDKSHEFIYQALLNIAESLEGEWIDFEQFLTMLTEAIVRVLLVRATHTPRKAGDRHSCWLTPAGRSASRSTCGRRWLTCSNST